MKQEFSRFLRSELIGRWQVGPSQVAAIDVTRESIVQFLQHTFEFSARRAAIEADEFLRKFEERLSLAAGSGHDQAHAEDTKSYKHISAA